MSLPGGFFVPFFRQS